MNEDDQPRVIFVPSSWYMGASGDPIARFDYLGLVLHNDGSVTWRSLDPDPEAAR